MLYWGIALNRHASLLSATSSPLLNALLMNSSTPQRAHQTHTPSRYVFRIHYPTLPPNCFYRKRTNSSVLPSPIGEEPSCIVSVVVVVVGVWHYGAFLRLSKIICFYSICLCHYAMHFCSIPQIERLFQTSEMFCAYASPRTKWLWSD